MASVWDFVKGGADYLVSREEERQKSEAEIKRAEALEKLRRETSDYEFTRDQAAKRGEVKDSLSAYNPVTGKFDQYNSEGTLIRSIDSAAHKAAYDDDRLDKTLDREHKRATIDNIAVDNDLQRQQLDLTRRGQDISVANSRRASGGTENADDILFAEYKDLQTLAATSGNVALVAAINSDWYNGVNNAKWNKAQQRDYMTRMRKYISSNANSAVKNIKIKED